MDDIGAELIEEDSVAAAHARLAIAEDIPSETQTRADIVQIVIAELAVLRHARIAGEQNIRKRARAHLRARREIRDIDVTVTAELLVPRKVGLPSDTQR